MADLPAESEVLWRQLQEVLLGHLRVANIPVWPAADGLTVKAVLRSYPQAVTAGHVQCPAQLLREHPELARQLADFFAAKGLG